MRIRRRDFLGAGGTLLASASLAGCAARVAPGTAAARSPASADSPFSHGVASGDPLQDRVVIWTRARRGDSPEPVEVEWFCALDADGRERVAAGTVVAGRERDHTVAIDVTGLQPGTTYYYGFVALGWRSILGRTRTAPRDTDSARFAVASCANYSQGFFNGYRCIAEHDDLDAVIHLGDYIYEYERGKYSAGAELDREPDPPHELLRLEDYRQRYAQYRSDPDLQAAHARHPFIAIWDDHESANNAWLGGAKNHDPSEGAWQARLAAATRAYMEWLPIRPTPSGAGGRLYRTFRFGTLCELFMLDGRIVGRDAQVEDRRDWGQVMRGDRSMLGDAQERWLHEGLTRSRADGVQWRLLGQQTMMAQLRRTDGIANKDQWDGYHAARERLLSAIEAGNLDNVVVLTGDIHSSWANELARDPFDATRYDPATGRGALATELICAGITSPSPYLRERTRLFPEWVRKTHPHVKYLEGVHRGYLIVDVGRARTRAEWHLLETVMEPSTGKWVDAVLEVESGSPHLKRKETQT
ncbi:MAG: alkaline phosphatase D family protein [Myxococcales bacterium]|nr:alkaline phosphatase D family protein [Myxococcales bacterium]